jgi:hypothetical protein
MFKFREISNEDGIRKLELKDDLILRRFIFSGTLMNEQIYLKTKRGHYLHTSSFRYTGKELAGKLAILERYEIKQALQEKSSGNKRIQRL